MVDGVGMGNQEGHGKVEMVLLPSQRDKERGLRESFRLQRDHGYMACEQPKDAP